jgi:nucleoside-diphosphate kinase
MSVQRTLILIKPDAVRRNLIGPVLSKLEESKLKLVAARLTQVPTKLAEDHYIDHVGKSFYSQLIEYITGKLHEGAAVMALVYEGEEAITKVRALAGDTNPEKAKPDTIRGMFGRVTTAGVFENVIHASATPPEAEKEVNLWFKAEDFVKK